MRGFDIRRLHRRAQSGPLYAHEFSQLQHAEKTRDALQASFGTLVEHAAGEGRIAAAGAASGEVAQLRELASGG